MQQDFQGSDGKLFELQILYPGEPIIQVREQNKNTLRNVQGHPGPSLEEYPNNGVFREDDR